MSTVSKRAVRTTKSSSVVSKKKVYQFGDLRYDFISACKHDISRDANPAQCPLCRLVNVAVAKHFQDEADAKIRGQQQSIASRIRLRYNLLDSWALNQPHLFEDIIIGHVVDLSLCQSLTDAITQMTADNATTDKFNYSALTKLLDRRRRIQQIGLFAALYLQTRIRKYCARRRVKRSLLQRFEYIPANSYRADFYLDANTHRKWHRYPALIMNERPATPRTITRRLNHQENRRATSLRHYQQATARMSLDPWEEESKYIIRLRQFAILRDVLSLAFNVIKERYYKTQPPPKPVAQKGKQQSKSSTEPPIAITPETIKTMPTVPVWLSLSAPGPSSRQLSIALTLRTPAMTTMGLETSDKVAEEALNTFNKRLRELELRAFEQLQCNSVDEVMAKLLCEDLLPSFSSVMHIALDEHILYNSSRTFGNTASKTSTTIATTDASAHKGTDQLNNSSSSSNSNSHEQSTDEKLSAAVLPMSLRLRPVNPLLMGPNGIFRLFFFEEHLVAASQISPLTYYPEIVHNREAISNLLRNFGNSLLVKTFVRKYFDRVRNAHDPDYVPMDISSASMPQYSAYATIGNVKSSAAIAPRKIENINGCSNVYSIPSDNEVFQVEGTDSLAPVTLSADETVTWHKKMKFLNKVGLWRERLKHAQGELMRRRGRQAPAAGEDRATSGSAASGKTTTVPLASVFNDIPDLVGTQVYDACVHKKKPAGSRNNAAVEQATYQETMDKYVVQSEQSILHRIQPDALAPTGERLNPCNHTIDLLVLDVSINLPVPSGYRVSKWFQGTPISSNYREGDHLSLKEFEKLTIEIHEFVGGTSCRNERPPANLDLALMTWDYFQSLRAKADKESIVIDEDAVKSIPNLNLWTKPNEQTGLSMQKAIAPTGALFSFRILGTQPSKEYLHQQLSNKTKHWLGVS